MESLEGLLRACTARVMDGERFCGSGFAVAPDRVVTCAHVVAGSSPGLVVWLGTRSVAVVGVDAFPPEPPPGCVSFPLPDLALLLLEQRVAAAGGDAGAGVWLTEGLPATGAELLGVGFSADSPSAAVGADTILVTTVGPVGDGFIKIKDDRVPSGMSGSPVLDRTTGRVCGMLKASRDYATSEGGWIVPVGVFARVLPEVVAGNIAAHGPGGAWWDLATDRWGWSQRLFGATDTAAKPVPPANPRPSWWLEPRHQVVDFHPRPQLAELRAWCATGTATPLRLITASGGVGKSRLGLQLCRDMIAAGWIAGLVRSGSSLEPFTTHPLRAAVDAGHRVLIVLDYAETFASDLPELIDAMVSLPADRVRVMMLARSVGRWWDQLIEHASGGHLVDPEPLRLANLGEDAESRRSILAEALHSFRAAIHGRDDADDESDNAAVSTVPPQLGEVSFAHQTVLSVHALALNHVLDEHYQNGSAQHVAAESSRGSRQGNPLHGVLAHERRYWLRVAAQAGITLLPGDPLVDPVLLVPTLYPARDVEDAVAAVGRIEGVPARQGGSAEGLARTLVAVYPNSNPEQPRVWDPLQPDRLAEALVVEVLAEKSSDARAADYVKQLLDGADIAQAVQALTVLVRAADTAGDETGHRTETESGQRRARAAITHLIRENGDAFLPAGVEVAVTLPDPADLLAILAPVVGGANASALRAVSARLPDFHLDFTTFAASVAETLVSRLDTADSALPKHDRAERAWALNNLGIRLDAVGRREDALAPTEEATQLYRELAAVNPAAYRPDLAAALNNLGVQLNAVGRREEARAAWQEAESVGRGPSGAETSHSFLRRLFGRRRARS